MFPLLPLLILLLLGPANAERLAVEGRLPVALLAIHRARVAPMRAVMVAPVEEKPFEAAHPEPRLRTAPKTKLGAPFHGSTLRVDPGWPTRAGPPTA